MSRYISNELPSIPGLMMYSLTAVQPSSNITPYSRSTVPSTSGSSLSFKRSSSSRIYISAPPSKLSLPTRLSSVRQAVQESAKRYRANEKENLILDIVREEEHILEALKTGYFEDGLLRVSNEEIFEVPAAEKDSDFSTYHFYHVQGNSTSPKEWRGSPDSTRSGDKYNDLDEISPPKISLPSISALLSTPYICHQFRPLGCPTFNKNSSILSSAPILPVSPSTKVNTHHQQLSQASPKKSSTKTSGLRRLRPASDLSQAIAKALCRKNIPHGYPADICWH